MFKYLLYLVLISLNLRLFWTQSVSLNGLDLPEGHPFDATNYLRLLSKVTANEKKNQLLEQNSNKTNNLSESVQQLRRSLSPTKEAPTHQCQYVVFYFGLILSQFVECILINEIPFSLCLGCSQQYSDLFNAYSDLTNSSVSNCSDSFLTPEKVDLIHNFFRNSISKWTDGNCDSCFGGKDKNNNLVANNDTIYFFQLTTNYTDCLQTQNKTNVTNNLCVVCKQSYLSVSDYFELLSLNSTHVCTDIIETIKDVRKHWSESLDCPVNSTSSLHFLALVFIVIAMPFVLYVIGKLFCVDKNNKTLMKQKRLSTFHFGSYESEPLIQH